MKKFVTVLIVLTLSIAAHAQLNSFTRIATIEADSLDSGGFGNVLAGMDFDNDGKHEIYAVNTDWFDEVGLDLVPRIYKYEDDGAGNWVVVWSTRLPLNFQNTWGALAPADLDNDGRWEVVWGPVNNFGSGLQPNPERIVVFETVGDGSDGMGVDNGDGTWAPNAQWTITMGVEDNLRPFKWVVTDIDSDGTDEIVAGCRVGDGIQIYSTDAVPDNGDGSENWTTEYTGITGTFYDMTVIGNTVYGIRSNGEVYSVSATAADTYAENGGGGPVGSAGGGSWNSAQAVDVNGDGNHEIIAASWSSSDRNVYLLVPATQGWVATYAIGEAPEAANRLYGGAAGNVDGDNGKLDFVFGTRQATTNGLIYRLEYQGGDMTDAGSWAMAAIDSLAHPTGSQYDNFAVGDLDGDGDDEIVYTGTARGASSGDVQPITVLNYNGAVGIDDELSNNAPTGYELSQNYPNPFNPNTTISFTIPTSENVSLTIYNVRGQVVKTLVNDSRSAGTHNIQWDGLNNFGQKVASGIYIYTLRTSNFVESKKMTMLK